MNKFCLISIILLISASSAVGVGEHLNAAYKGYVTIDGKPSSNASISVFNSACKLPPQELKLDNGSYTMRIRWYGPDSPDGVYDGETITFQVNGINAKTWTVTEADTNPTQINLEILSSSALTPCSSTSVRSPSASGGSSSGGGGGAVSSEPVENIVKTENKEEILSKDVPKTFSFTTPELPVSQVTITSNINAGLINVKLELLKNRSTLAKDDAPGTVYKYVSIWVGTSGFAVPDNIKDAVIKFKLPSSWITSNGFKDADIVMQRWNGTHWVKLVTEKKSSEGNYTLYETKTNAFSPFVISGIKETTAAVTSPGQTAVATQTQGSNATSGAKDAPGFGIALAIAGTLAVVLRRRHN